MLKNRAVAAKHTPPQHITHPPRDFDRAFIAQQTGESWIQEIQTRKLLGAPHLDLSTNGSRCVDPGSRALALHPEYATTRHVFVDYANAPANDESAYPVLGIARPALSHHDGWLGFGSHDGASKSAEFPT